MKKVAVIGCGFVGEALCNGLIEDKVDLLKVDPKFNTSLNDLVEFDPEIIFLSVPTPMNNDGTQDISIVEDVMKELIQHKIKKLLVLKSTVLPNYIKKINLIYPNLVYNPEFLREKTANEDFINSNTIIFGGEHENCVQASNFYKTFTNCTQKDHIFLDHISASLAKYTINTFLASKVIFFNELNEIFNNSNTNVAWEDFIKALMTDERMGSSHMFVPGPDGRLGYGGPCFPKDVKAFINYSMLVGSEFTLLKKVSSINNDLRSKYKNLTEREKVQNINFDKDI